MKYQIHAGVSLRFRKPGADKRSSYFMNTTIARGFCIAAVEALSSGDCGKYDTWLIVRHGSDFRASQGHMPNEYLEFTYDELVDSTTKIADALSS